MSGRVEHPSANGKGMLAPTELMADEAFPVGRDMPVRNDEIASILEGQHTLTLELRAANLAAQQQTAAISRLCERLEGSKDRTSLPNWLMPVLVSTLFSLLLIAGGFVYNTIDRRITDNRQDQIQQHGDDATEVRILRTYVIQLTQEMNKRGIQVPPMPETKH